MLFVSWRSQMEALSEIMTRSIAVCPQCTIVTDGQTDDTTPTIPSHWLVSHESAIKHQHYTVQKAPGPVVTFTISSRSSIFMAGAAEAAFSNTHYLLISAHRKRMGVVYVEPQAGKLI